MFSLSVSRAWATGKSQIRGGSKGPRLPLGRCRPLTEVLEGRQLLATGVDSGLGGAIGAGVDRTVALAAFEANPGTRTWTPAVTDLRMVQGESSRLRVASVTSNQSLGPVTATIDWGDGVTTPGLAAGYAIDYASATDGDPAGVHISGEHVYRSAGNFVVRTTIVAADGDATTVTNRVVVAPSLTLSGALDPASDTGASNLDGITATTQPRFQGNATPNATVQLFATRHDSGGAFPIGQAVADAQGQWSLSSTPLVEGTYRITASVTSPDGRVLSAVAIGAGNAGGPLVVDTTGPRVAGLTLNVPGAQIQVSFNDNLSGPDLRGASTSNIASLQRIVRSRASSIAIWPLSVSDGGRSVLLGLSRPLGNGRYTFRIPASAVRDLAGNTLDGEFRGSFATGDGQPGGDLAATFQVARRQATTPRSIQAAVPHPTQRPGSRLAPGSSGLAAARRALRHGARS